MNAATPVIVRTQYTYRPVRLEGLPLQLLMYLVEHHRQLVTREQIANELWGKDVFVDIEQGINTAIRKIRMALDDDSAQVARKPE